MTFNEEMVGWYFPGARHARSGPRRAISPSPQRIPATGTPAGAVTCRFDVHMTIRDVNEFIDGYEHEAQLAGTITFGQFEGAAPVTFPIDASAQPLQLPAGQSRRPARPRCATTSNSPTGDGAALHARRREVHAEGRRRRVERDPEFCGLHHSLLPRLRTARRWRNRARPARRT